MKTVPSKKDIQKWSEALRSGKFHQAKGALQADDGYCCLGVACKIFIPEDKQLKRKGKLSGDIPYSAQENSPKWLQVVNAGFESYTGLPLSALNDALDYTFDEIADLLELVYVHDALKLR